jgi:hypothetical protein
MQANRHAVIVDRLDCPTPGKQARPVKVGLFAKAYPRSAGLKRNMSSTVSTRRSASSYSEKLSGTRSH